MSWSIECCDSQCGKVSLAANIVDLIENHRDENGLFQCSACENRGYIEKSFSLQEPGETWEPYLKGILPLGEPGGTYQPFVFLVGGTAKDEPQHIWFSYYKDLRSIGGRLKLGYGPGGPPVLSIEQVLSLIKTLAAMELIDQQITTRFIQTLQGILHRRR